MPDRASKRHEVFMGAQSTLPILHADLQSFEASLLQRFQSLLESSPQAGGMSEHGCLDASASKSIPSPPETRAPSPCFGGVATMTSTPLLSSSLPALSRRPHYRSRPPRIPRTTSLDDAILYWETGNVEKGLLMPLKSWALVYQPLEYRSEVQKLSMVSIVYEEFVHHCHRDWDVFNKKYPNLRHQYTKLVKAVRVARIARGEAKPRRACIY
jgi:hypothetical protein